MSNYKKIIDNKNELLKFRELVVNADFDKTPTKTEVVEKLNKELGVNAEMTVIKSIKGNFGTPTFTIKLRVYEDEKAKNFVETKNRKKKKGAKK